jgi:hypothetical protein
MLVGRKLLLGLLVAAAPVFMAFGPTRAAEPAPLSAELENEHRAIEEHIRQFRADVDAQARLQRETLHQAALIVETDRDPVDVVVRRTRVLLEDLRALEGAPKLEREAEELAALETRSRETAIDDAKRMQLFAEVCALRRRIAFSNPLLDFDRIIFLKHDRARFEHMVDQYYGFHAEPRGGVYVLEHPFSDTPVIRDVLEGATVQNGRLEGRSLDGGSFISLDLDFDARTILFAWTEAQVPVEPTDYTPWELLFTPESTYHIFKAGVDGADLVQLTDGPVNDFDPCWLPNGRICFVSERRGGYLRCGIRPNPTYTLHSMDSDGSNITTLSYHETHEWHPSVNNDGMIVYSRWDYVDRDSDIAHHLWLTFPDGRDPRSMHGNYPAVRESRPWMELSIRAIPGSHRYVAVSTPHHGQNYGSMVLIDQQPPDDGAMSQLKRVTPEVALPEAEVRPGVPCDTHAGKNHGESEVYGTPWPLSETYFLCVYDRGQKNYGLYLLDAFGNRELLYRDPAIACLDPIPLRARPRPPVLPERVHRVAEGESATGYLAIMNIYESELPWPPDTEIAALRIVQLFPKTTPAQDDPNIGFGRNSLARGVLGTAPVEPDGSVYCEVPAQVPLYFQALDTQGRAVQTMRSATYVHPGETLTCMGCHEDKRRTVLGAGQLPLALQRPPSALDPEVDGAYPLLYSRLVQPVLDRHCVSCHDENDDAPGLAGDTFGEWGWSESYHALSNLVWAKHGGNGALRRNEISYSVPGEVGARASGLLKLLEDGHHDVTLPEADLRRLTLWLDCNSVFYGAYHEMLRQARGEAVKPTLY